MIVPAAQSLPAAFNGYGGRKAGCWVEGLHLPLLGQFEAPINGKQTAWFVWPQGDNKAVEGMAQPFANDFDVSFLAGPAVEKCLVLFFGQD
jgi:hypothetical protein